MRCAWCSSDPVYQAYHDHEWGRPQHDDRHLFEMLVLEGAQAGLSWITILRRRDGYRRVFRGFDPARVAAMSDADLAQALLDPGIIRNQRKVRSARTNAGVFLEMQAKHGSFAHWLWSQVDGEPIVQPVLAWQHLTTSSLSDQISRALKKAGMGFVGSTIIYAYLQAVGVVNDHEPACFCRTKQGVSCR